MTTPIEDSELNTELQELYLKSKQWLSDLEFTHTEIEFIKVLLLKGGNDPELLIQTADIHNNLLQLQNSISEFMHQLESLIIKETQVMDILMANVRSIHSTSPTCSAANLRISRV